MPANLETSAVATGLEQVSFHSNPKERQCQRILNGNETGQTLEESEGREAWHAAVHGFTKDQTQLVN